jgi:hypothetical protein
MLDEMLKPPFADQLEVVLHIELQERIRMRGRKQRYEVFAEEQRAAVGEGHALHFRTREARDLAASGCLSLEHVIVQHDEAAVAADAEVELHRGAEPEAVGEHCRREERVSHGAAQAVPLEPRATTLVSDLEAGFFLVIHALAATPPPPAVTRTGIFMHRLGLLH